MPSGSWLTGATGSTRAQVVPLPPPTLPPAMSPAPAGQGARATVLAAAAMVAADNTGKVLEDQAVDMDLTEFDGRNWEANAASLAHLSREAAP